MTCRGKWHTDMHIYDSDSMQCFQKKSHLVCSPTITVKWSEPDFASSSRVGHTQHCKIELRSTHNPKPGSNQLNMVLGPFLLPRGSGKWRLLEIPAPKMCNVILVLTIASWVRGRSNTALQKSPATFFVKVPSHKSSFLIVKFPFPLMALMASQSTPPKTYHPRNSRP